MFALNSFVFPPDTRERTPAGGSGGRLYNFELSLAVRQVGGKDFHRRGEPQAARFHISDRNQGASEP